MEIITSGRSDLKDYFRLSGIFDYEKLKHNPFLVFIVSDYMEVRIVKSVSELLEYPDDTKVMNQWPGKVRSDFFKFTVGEVRAYNEKRK